MKRLYTVAGLLSVFYLLLLISKRMGYHIYFIHTHLADIICIPFILTNSLIILRLWKRNDQLILGQYKIAFICIYYALIFEWILPRISNVYVSDILDVICYIIGGCIFYFIQKHFLTHDKKRSYRKLENS
ncbi:MAG: hypothetical protein MRY83_06800 [Flavobacteriales bacterium]|nr:hypothetical protein [Flavobacteriales bacterium]